MLPKLLFDQSLQPSKADFNEPRTIEWSSAQCRWPLSGKERGSRKLQIEPGLELLSRWPQHNLSLLEWRSVSFQTISEFIWTSENSRTWTDHLTSSGFDSITFSASDIAGTITDLLSSFWIQLCVNGWLCKITWNDRSPQEVPLVSLYFFPLHPKACADDTRRNIQNT